MTKGSIWIFFFVFLIHKSYCQEDEIILKKTGQPFDYSIKIIKVTNDSIFYKAFWKMNKLSLAEVSSYRFNKEKDSTSGTGYTILFGADFGIGKEKAIGGFCYDINFSVGFCNNKMATIHYLRINEPDQSGFSNMYLMLLGVKKNYKHFLINGNIGLNLQKIYIRYYSGGGGYSYGGFFYQSPQTTGMAGTHNLLGLPVEAKVVFHGENLGIGLRGLYNHTIFLKGNLWGALITIQIGNFGK